MARFTAYPRPLLRRSSWISLDGTWEFAIHPQAELTQPADVKWNDRIQAPFSPETRASGIEDTGLFTGCWYRRTFECAAVDLGQYRSQRLLVREVDLDRRCLGGDSWAVALAHVVEHDVVTVFEQGVYGAAWLPA